MRPAAGAGEHSVSEDVRIEVERPVRADVAALLREARAMMAALYPPESCHGLDLSSYERPEVTLFVARSAGVAVACGAWQLHGDGSAEVKSMFVVPEARGRGVGKALMEAVLAHPHVRDLSRLALVTDDAHGLYEKFGFGPSARLMERPAPPPS
jgi:putative acetyltransferase